MGLSTDLISQFVKITKPEKAEKKIETLNGVTKIVGGKTYVQLDGSDLLTPVDTTANSKDGEKVTVSIGNHKATITGNYSSPAARTGDVEEVSDQITQVEILVADKVSTEEFDAEVGRIDNLTTDNVLIKERLTATEANIETLTAEDVRISGKLEAVEGSIETLETTKLSAEIAEATYATIQELEATNADIYNLNATYGEFEQLTTSNFEAINGDIQRLETDKLSADQADVKYAQIDFANIDEAAVEKLFSESGIIADLVMSEGHVTGKLVGVTIIGDLIEGGTVKADKLVIQGEDGLYYKLNTNGESVSAEQTEYNSLSGSVITANTITAEKINVDDLVAFDATIGGFNITDSSIYSGTKSSVNNGNQGIYLGKDGQIAFGDSSNYIKYYKASDNTYKLEITAASIKMGGSSKTVEEELNEIRDEVTCNLRIESSRGTVFKNDSISTVLSAVIYRGSQRITDITALRAAMGNSAYLQWKWQRLDETSFGIISASDSRIGNNGFTFVLSPEDVNTKITFMCELIV